MYTPSDADWIREARRREVYQASEARWSMEGVTVPSSQNSGRWLGKLKTLLTNLKLSQAAREPTRVSQNGELTTSSQRPI